MKISIEDYIASSLCIRKAASEKRKASIAQIHSEVAQRICFSFPLIQFDSYNIHSCIISLQNGNKTDHYTLVDHSMFEFAEQLLYYLENDQPNLTIVAYRQLRKNIAIANSNKEGEKNYATKQIFVTERDLLIDLDYLNRDPSENEFFTEKYAMMLRFHFLHEYSHYLWKNPVRDAKGIRPFTDIVINSLFASCKSRISKTEDRYKKNVLENELSSFIHEYSNNPSFLEEIICDISAILCLLELSTVMPPREIIDAIISYLNVQYAIWLAKNPDAAFDPGNIIKFRINVVFELANMLGDKEFADILAIKINQGNRFANVIDLYCEDIKSTKHEQFYANILQIVAADILNGVLSDGKQEHPNLLNNIYFFTTA